MLLFVFTGPSFVSFGLFLIIFWLFSIVICSSMCWCYSSDSRIDSF